MSDAAELWRQSLHAVFRLLRNSTSVDVDAYKFWAETYYQISILVFPSETALTPYKLKLLLYFQILKQGHLTLESSHRSHGEVQSSCPKVFLFEDHDGGRATTPSRPIVVGYIFQFLQFAANIGL